MNARTLKSWWSRLTWQQVVLAVAGMAGVGMLVRHVPVDVAKEWGTILGSLLVAGASAGALLNGRERASIPAPAPTDDGK
jgi:uncharacterized protein (DUF697 family)